MSGTSLVILAMYSTVNVAGLGKLSMSSAQLASVLALLMAAMVLTFAGMVYASLPPRRHVPKGPTLASVKRLMAERPGQRR